MTARARPPAASPPSRRRFVQGLALAGGALGSLGIVAGRPRAQALSGASGPPVLFGPAFDLAIAETPANVTGRPRIANTVNGSHPGPTLYWREGDEVTLKVTNRLGEPTSIHWHGIRLPTDMDGVPGLSFRGIMPGETFTYRFPVRQAGTYWYHSHSGMQEQVGLHGALVLQPRGRDPHPSDREHVVVLSDWTDDDPMNIVANLKMQGDYYDYGQRTVGSLARELKRDGLASTLRERNMWARMRMTPSDILDVSGATYTYLVNGQPPRANWTGLFQPGERVRLRLVNASAMTLFDVRVPGLKIEVVQSDGCDVHPVSVDQLRIGAAETYDVVVTPPDARAYTLFAQAMDRSGYARATLAPRLGMTAEVPPMDPRPVRTMVDMGMGGMKGMAGAGAGMQMGGMSAAPVPSGQQAAYAHDDVVGASPAMAAMGMGQAARRGGAADMAEPGVMPMQMAMAGDPRDRLPVTDASGAPPPAMWGGINVDNVAMQTKNRQGEAGDGLEHDGRRTLVYTDLRALKAPPDTRAPTREIVFHLTGNMQRWTWGFDGEKFSQAPPVELKLGERVRFILVNDTMMEHPIHLHGLFSEVENGQDGFQPLKHTILVKPGERMSYLVSADTPGHWAFHCHLLYHMETGMMRTVVVS